MPTPDTFAFLLRKSETEYYRMVNGVVQLLPAPTEKQYGTEFGIQSPEGWQETGIRWERDKDYGGLFQTYSESLEFYGDGAQIIYEVYEMYGVSGDLQLEVRKVDFDTWLYEDYFVANIDFSTIVCSEDRITCALRDTGTVSLLKANSNINYDIEMKDNPDALEAYIDGVVLKNASIWTISDNPLGDNVNVFNKPQMNPVSSETQYTDDVITQEYSETLDTNHFYVASVDQILAVEYDFSFEVVPLGGIGYIGSELLSGFIVKHVDNTTTSYWLVNQPNYAIFLNHNYILKSTVSIPLLKGETLYYFSTIQGASAEWHYNIDPSLVKGIIKISYDTRIPAIKPKGLRIYDAVKQVVSKLSKGKLGVVSDYLNGDPFLKDVDTYPYWHSYFCGDSFRLIEDAKMAMNFSDIRKDLFSRLMCKVGLEGNNIRIEKMDFFYDEANEIADLGDVADLEYVASQDQLFNEIEFGYANQTFDSLNGRDEFNTTHNKEIPFDGKIKQKLDLVSPYNASMYAITAASYNRDGKPTTDSKSDSEIFMIALNPIEENIADPMFPIYVRPPYRPNKYYYGINPDNVRGILAPESAFNMAESPERNFIRAARYLAITTYKMPAGTEIALTSATKNQNLVSNLGSGFISESAPNVLPTGRPYYQPGALKFKAIVPDSFSRNVSANKNGYITVHWSGLPYKIYLNKGGNADAENGIFEFEGQLHTDTDTSALQKYA